MDLKEKIWQETKNEKVFINRLVWELSVLEDHIISYNVLNNIRVTQRENEKRFNWLMNGHFIKYKTTSNKSEKCVRRAIKKVLDVRVRDIAIHHVFSVIETLDDDIKLVLSDLVQEDGISEFPHLWTIEDCFTIEKKLIPFLGE